MAAEDQTVVDRMDLTCNPISLFPRGGLSARLAIMPTSSKTSDVGSGTAAAEPSSLLLAILGLLIFSRHNSSEAKPGQ